MGTANRGAESEKGNAGNVEGKGKGSRREGVDRGRDGKLEKWRSVEKESGRDGELYKHIRKDR